MARARAHLIFSSAENQYERRNQQRGDYQEGGKLAGNRIFLDSPGGVRGLGATIHPY